MEIKHTFEGIAFTDDYGTVSFNNEREVMSALREGCHKRNIENKDDILDTMRYVYNDILSYVFFVEYFVGGAHPNHFIFTINYDKNNNSFITYMNNLNVLSDYSRRELIKDPRIVNTGMLLDGTRPIKDNFKNFVFTDKGYIFYFERYKIAPYSSGDTSLLVPYSILKGKD